VSLVHFKSREYFSKFLRIFLIVFDSMCTQKHEIDDILQLLADEDVDPDALASGLEDLAQVLQPGTLFLSEFVSEPRS